MFTGIVEELGQIVAVEASGDGVRLAVLGPLVTTDAVHGASIAVDGVCLTAVNAPTAGTFTADVMAETLRRSTLGGLAVGASVNLERPMTLGGRLGGHLVQGHVDGVGHLLHRTPGERWDVLRFAVPPELARYVVMKGSITISGVSLTVSGVSEPGTAQPWLEVSLIPTTLEGTTLGALHVGAGVNLEVDVVAKYVERLLAHGDALPTTAEPGLEPSI